MKKKHILMLKSFIKVMCGNKNEIKSIIPDAYYQSIYTIDYENLNNITTLLFDIDNTITKVDDLDVPLETQELFSKLKQKFNILLFSNNSEARVKPIAEKLDLPMIYNAGKPAKEAYDNALKQVNSTKENTIAIGDQLITDIIGAKKYGIKAILVDQLSKENNVQTSLAQKLQKQMIKKLSKLKLFQMGKYYPL